MSNENQETIADIVDEMRKRAEEVYAGQAGYPESWEDQMNDDEIREIADRIEAAEREREATREKSSQIGNAEKMRDALSGLLEIVCIDCNSSYKVDGKCVKCPRVVSAEAALSAPPRNCDVGTAKEQEERFRKFCASHYNINNVDGECDSCPIKEVIGVDCAIAWSQLPYEEGGTK